MNKSQKIYLKDVANFLGEDCTIKGMTNELFFTNARSIEDAQRDSIVWISPKRKDIIETVKNTLANIIVCDKSLESQAGKCLIVVNNPRLSFMRIISEFLSDKIEFTIHPTAIIHPQAEIHPKVFIGPNTYIGNSKIGSMTIIKGNCYIDNNVTIGSNVLIQPGVVVGADGFGFERNEKGEFEKFPHIGGVIIEDNVEIGSNTCIDRGTLANTIIKEGAKIDNLVHIAHNVIIGKHTAVIANSMIGGGTTIGDYSWIAPSASIRDTVRIGQNVTIGLGAVVTKGVGDNETLAGNPAKPLNEFISLQNKLKNL